MRSLIIAFLSVIGIGLRAQNIFPYTPTDWDGPLVVSSVTETNTNDSGLKKGYNLYVDYALRHDFGVALENLSVQIFVDDRLMRTSSFSSLSPSPTFGNGLDRIITVDSGMHEVKVIFDVENQFAETNEEDNEIILMIDVQDSPEFTVPEATTTASVEFFVDHDPGHGNAASIASAIGDQMLVVPLDDISTGFHRLYLRSQNVNGLWGPSESLNFYNLQSGSNNIAMIEYYVDNDPGQGMANSISFNTNDESVSFNVGLDDISQGFHQLFIRAKSENGTWSQLQRSAFLVEKGAGRQANIAAIEYYFIGPSSMSDTISFPIESPETELNLIAPLNTDFLEDGLSYTLVVQAVSESGIRSFLNQHPFVYDVNFPPEVTNPIDDLAILEDAPDSIISEDVSALFSDADGDLLSFSVNSDNIDVMAVLQTDSLVIKLTENFSGLATITVTASDGKAEVSDTLQITVEPVNDPPVFTLDREEVVLDENFVGIEVIQVTKGIVPNDETDQLVSYSLSPAAVEFANVDIDEVTGTITIESVAEGFGMQEFQVIANDGQITNNLANQTFTLVVLQGNQAPIIANQLFSLDENSVVGVAVGSVIASDPEDSTITFSIISGNALEGFALTSSSGELTVLDSSILNFEVNPSFNLTVEVSDGELSSSAQMTININDVNDTPVFDDQLFNIAENSAAETVIGTLTATDEDGDVLTFSIPDEQEDATPFNLNATSGVLTVASSTALDFEVQSSFVFSVQVSDELGSSSTATVEVSLSDVDEPNIAPVILDQEFSIPEQSPVGTEIGMLIATDEDGSVDDLAFAVLSGNDGGAFSLNAATGVLSVLDAATLIFSTHPTFQLEVEVTDSEGAKDQAVVTVKLIENEVLGISGVEGIKIYPIPAKDHFRLETDITVESLQLIDVTGKVVKSFMTSEYYTIRGIPAGIYHLELTTPSKKKRLRMIIQ
ncbi:MAG: cadherin domain-containing protein [Cyclobacteriaceae bacterium]|nr:cadherin domain-containing protein [Cyclobacteriaceae bacterium HetDA_MAG_MS6]